MYSGGSEAQRVPTPDMGGEIRMESVKQLFEIQMDNSEGTCAKFVVRAGVNAGEVALVIDSENVWTEDEVLTRYAPEIADGIADWYLRTLG